MQLTLEADYAIRIITFLIECDERVDAKKISENTGVTLRFSLKILRKLVSSKIVKSYKGANGGYELNKSPSNINLLEVMESVDCHVIMNKCLENEDMCSHPNVCHCKTRNVFLEISNDIKDKLSKVTFDKLV